MFHYTEVLINVLLSLIQASLGETKKPNENVPLFVKCDDKKLVVGTLSGEKCAQIQYDLVFEKDFELSHSSKNASVYFCGYKTIVADDPENMFDGIYSNLYLFYCVLVLLIPLNP